MPNGWVKDLSRYELRVMHFADPADVSRALARVGHDGLEDMPYWIPRPDVMVVPKEAISVFRESGLAFREAAVVEPSNGGAEPLEQAGSEYEVGDRLTSEEKEWLRQQLTEEEIVASLRELREKGGLELHDFLAELEEAVERHE
jgi:hypothetical protein